jgi:tripartite-type tricarboxylate transporter receptor subunit TctC
VREKFTHAALAMAAAATLATAHAQTSPKDTAYPVKPIRLVVPFPPGGTPDLQGRMLTEKVASRLGQQIVIDNRGGANGIIGMEIVARSPADGYTLIIATVGNFSVHPHLYKLPYDPLKDLVPVIHLATTPGAVVVHPSVPAKSVKELIALARARPGELNYGSAGIGGFGHMCTALFNVMTKTKMTHVSYKGLAGALTDLIAGNIQVSMNSAFPTIPHIKSGRVRGLATTGAKRLDILAELPTVAEAGVPGYENSTWSAIAAPARTPQAIVERLNREFGAALALPETKERFTASGSTITGGTPEQFLEYWKAELAKYGKLIRDAGIKPESGT